MFNLMNGWHRLALYAVLACSLATCTLHAASPDPTLTPDELGWIKCVEDSDYTDMELERCDARWGEHDMRELKARMRGNLVPPIHDGDDDLRN